MCFPSEPKFHWIMQLNQSFQGGSSSWMCKSPTDWFEPRVDSTRYDLTCQRPQRHELYRVHVSLPVAISRSSNSRLSAAIFTRQIHVIHQRHLKSPAATHLLRLTCVPIPPPDTRLRTPIPPPCQLDSVFVSVLMASACTSHPLTRKVQHKPRT